MSVCGTYRCSVTRTFARRAAGGADIPGFSFDYAYDPIGNRTSATVYGPQGNSLVSAYTANALNQYTQRTIPGFAAVRGEANTNAAVTVNENSVVRRGAYFFDQPRRHKPAGHRPRRYLLRLHRQISGDIHL